MVRCAHYQSMFVVRERVSVFVTSSLAAGECAQDKACVLQGQRVPEAHSAQGHTVQDRQGFSVCARCGLELFCMIVGACQLYNFG